MIDLLADLIARLDHMFDRLQRSSRLFPRWSRTDPAQRRSRARRYYTPQVKNMDALFEAAARADEPHDIHRLLLELHQLRTKLDELIAELERRHGLG